MMLSTGIHLGPYEILAPLGAGGMGEVYRAQDTRLGRDVAIKVLPESFSTDSDRLRRFEQEAKAASLLNHPNITVVYDIGSHEGAPYVVQELLEGETLRAVLAGGRLSTRRAIDYSLQIARGLAAAHEKGIVHRDLKPENLFVTRDGRVKILDFGLAKLIELDGSSRVTSLPTATAGTEPGVMLGTIGYMSPEQVRGRAADARSDIFAFGTILYEMLAGRRAFQGDSAADTMSAILKEDVPDLSVTNQNVSPGLERIIRHCLEKNPEQRFHSAHDLAFDLEALSGVSGSAPAPRAAPSGQKRYAVAAGLIAATLALLLGGYWAGRKGLPGTRVHEPNDHVSRKRLTFRRGNVLFARFTQDAQNIVYGASWGDRPTEIFFSHVASPETRPLGIEGASLLSVSPSGELAILLKSNNLFGTGGSGTLARVPLVGGSPRRLAEKITAADWTPDGRDLVVLRDAGSKTVLEFPLGKPVYSAAAFLSSLRVSPDGKRVALIETDGNHYWIDVIDAAGNRRVLAKDFVLIDSLAWHPSGTEIWFDGVDRRNSPGLFGVSLEGAERSIATTTDLEVLHDVARDGSVLVEREISRREIFGAFGGERQERNLSWLESSTATALSDDGKEMLFWEGGEGGGANSSVYIRATDGSPAVRLGDGRACDLSPDGKWALTIEQVSGSARLVLLPTGAGEPIPIPVEGVQLIWAGFFPDGNRLMIIGSEAGRGVRGYVVDRSGGKPRPFTPELANGGAISPDGQLVADEQADRHAVISAVATGASRPVAGLDADDVPIQWSADGEKLYVTHYGEAPMTIWRLNLKSGRKELWKTLMPADRTGFDRIDQVMVTRDGASYAYSYTRVTDSDLFLVKGLK